MTKPNSLIKGCTEGIGSMSGAIPLTTSSAKIGIQTYAVPTPKTLVKAGTTEIIGACSIGVMKTMADNYKATCNKKSPPPPPPGFLENKDHMSDFTLAEDKTLKIELIGHIDLTEHSMDA